MGTWGQPGDRILVLYAFVDRRTDNANIDFVIVSASECPREGTIRSRWRSRSSTVHPRHPIPTRPSSDSSCHTAGSENPSHCLFRDIEPLDRVAWESNSRSLLGRGGSLLGHGSVLHRGQSMDPSHTLLSRLPGQFRAKCVHVRQVRALCPEFPHTTMCNGL